MELSSPALTASSPAATCTGSSMSSTLLSSLQKLVVELALARSLTQMTSLSIVRSSSWRKMGSDATMCSRTTAKTSLSTARQVFSSSSIRPQWARAVRLCRI
ncbi:unnamed protein product [Linum tenue]|uniref:Secreted protein n=1 Tax=Linum tenue TaxID=586396 RepID=A0AAV0NVP3_9ROSI|nr:unnamed protein product [Linum tenue]CAI0462906.1 unnamed protein product [Linum tenue]